MSSAVVIDAIRTPIGRADGRAGCFRDVRADELSAGLITELVARTAIDPALIEDVRWGCVQQQGEQGYDIDCENGDFRLIASGAALISCAGLVPSVSDYIEHRNEHLAEICALHGCETGVAKRLPNIVGNGGTYYTWLRNNNLEPRRTSGFNGKRCKTFLPEDKCRSDEPNMARELHALPRGEVGVELLFLGRNFILKLTDFLIDIHAEIGFLGMIAQAFQLLLEVDKRFLEIEQMLHSAKRVTGRRAIRKTLLTKAITVDKPARR